MDSSRYSRVCDVLLGGHVQCRLKFGRWVSSLDGGKNGVGERGWRETDRRNSGTENTQLSDTANGVLYGVFAIAGFFAGSINVGAQTPWTAISGGRS